MKRGTSPVFGPVRAPGGTFLVSIRDYVESRQTRRHTERRVKQPFKRNCDYSHSMSVGVDGVCSAVTSCHSVHIVHSRLPRYPFFGTHLVLTNVTTPTRSDGLHVQTLWVEQEIEEAHGENPIFVHIGPHDILDNHNLSEAVIDSKKGALLLRHLLW